MKDELKKKHGLNRPKILLENSVSELLQRAERFFHQIELIKIGAQRGSYVPKLGPDDSEQLIRNLELLLRYKEQLKTTSSDEKKLEVLKKIEPYFGCTILDFVYLKEESLL